MNGTPPLVVIDRLQTLFPIRKGLLRRTVGAVRAVDGVSFAIGRGRTLGLVGESGCGKTTVGRSLLRLVEPTAGRVTFAGHDVLAAGGAALRGLRRRMQIVFQDPYGSLNPRMKVRSILEEGLVIHGLGTPGERLERMTRALARTGMTAQVAIEVEHLEDALQIPVQAVLERGKRFFCITEAGGEIAAREIQVRSANETSVVIADGLVAGEKVVLAPQSVESMVALPEAVVKATGDKKKRKPSTTADNAGTR